MKKEILDIVKKWFGLIALILLIPSLIVNFFLYQKSQKLSEGILVLGVIDGDTLVLDGKVRLRLRDLDAPELEFCGGQEAKNLLEQLTNGKRVILQERILDQKGRPMSLVYVDDTLINLAMLKSGWVRYHHDQSSQSTVLKEAADKARLEAKGIFSPKCYQKENPDNPKCNIKGNIDKNSSARKYYFPGCSQYNFTIVEKDIGEAWYCTEQEAQKAGFSKAATCK